MLSKTQIRQHLMQMVHPNDGVPYIKRHLDLLFNKHKLVARLQPKSICEIGVRCGYSMLMFKLAVPHAKLLGIDYGKAEHGGFVGAIEHAIKYVEFLLIERDSQKIEKWLYTSHEFWHIDGDHSAQGTYHDLSIAFNNGCKWALVDDYGRITETKQGTDGYLANGSFHTEMIDEYQLLITRKD